LGGVLALSGALIAKSFHWPVGATIAALSFLGLLLGRMIKLFQSRALASQSS
jgi:hypothetical protein